MVRFAEAVRRTLARELEVNPKCLVFGEDVGRKGGVHLVTEGLQKKFGAARVFDTSLSEEGIVGRAVGMAISGLMPVAEIQFRKYADPAAEQLNNCGTLRWRTANRFAAPIVVRMPGGFGKDVGDPWHSLSDEVRFAHAYGWQVAMPSNAADAVGLLRSAMRGANPTVFFEHRSLLMTSDGSAHYPGDEFIVPFGRASVLREGSDLTLVTWGALVHRCAEAAARFDERVELLDLRTIAPWDRARVLDVGWQDWALSHRPRRQHHRGIWGRDRGNGGERGVLVARRAGRPTRSGGRADAVPSRAARRRAAERRPNRRANRGDAARVAAPLDARRRS